MLAALTTGDPQVVVAVSPAVLIVVGIGLFTWGAVLTVLVLRRSRDDGEPVYRRLPNGRIRFSWVIATHLIAAQRHAAHLASTTDPDTEPLAPTSAPLAPAPAAERQRSPLGP